MKKFLLVALLFWGGNVFAQGFFYKCSYEVCSYSDGCSTYFKSLLIEGKKVYYWMGEDANEDARYVSKGVVTQQLDNGNYLVTGKSLISAYEKQIFVKPRGWLYREVEVYQSLMSGRPYGRFIEITHVRDKRSSDPTKEAKPVVEEHKCTRVK